jgi:hypothetical protein
MSASGSSLPPPHRVGAAASRVREVLIALGLGIGALIHLMPLLGLSGSEGLQRLYGLSLDDPDLILLLRHRAVLFGLLSIGLLGAIRIRAWRGPMLGAGLISALSFLGLAGDLAEHGEAIRRIFLGDVVAIVGWLLAAGLHLHERWRAAPGS